jgi:tetratricopeptide (TPR) repeat protein
MSPERIVVIDTDAAMANLTVKQALAMVVEEVKVSHDPEEGYQAILTRQYTAAIIDWKLKGEITGLSMLTRIRRNRALTYFPMIISTGFSQKEDLRIITDYPCTVVLDKPLTTKSIANALGKLNSENQWYLTNEKNIRDAFSSPSLDQASAKELVDLLLLKNPKSAPLAMLVATHLMKNNFDALALNLCDKHLAADPKCVVALNVKSKILAKTGDMKGSMDSLCVAQSISPHNIERLCMLGEIEISLQNPEAAIANFRKALAVDSKDSKANIGMIMANGLKSGAVPAIGDGGSIAKMLNNLGAELASSGEYQKAIKYYMLSFAFVGSNDLQSRISFNMGLSFKKWSKLPQAKFWLAKSLALSFGAFSKALRHLEGMEHIVAAAGFGRTSSQEVRTPTPVVVAKPPEPVAKIVPAPAAPIPAPKATLMETPPDEQFEEDDISFLEEEIVSARPPVATLARKKPAEPVKSAAPPKTAEAKSSFEAMVSAIDKVASFDLDISFDDAN